MSVRVSADFSPILFKYHGRCPGEFGTVNNIRTRNRRGRWFVIRAASTTSAIGEVSNTTPDGIFTAAGLSTMKGLMTHRKSRQVTGICLFQCYVRPYLNQKQAD
jgi:hypothetical protein